MIYIEKDTVNKVPLEISDTLPSSYTYFLLEFQPEFVVDSPSRYWTSPDMSLYPRRCNVFEIEDSSTGSTASAVDNQPINLLAGQYNYKVYASETSIDINNLSSLLATSPVQNGRMLVNGLDTVIDDVYK